MNLKWIQNARRAFINLYGEKKGEAVCGAVLPGVLGDFRKVLQSAPEGKTVSETYRLDDKRGDVVIEGRREGDALHLTALTVCGSSVALGGEVKL